MTTTVPPVWSVDHYHYQIGMYQWCWPAQCSRSVRLTLWKWTEHLLSTHTDAFEIEGKHSKHSPCVPCLLCLLPIFFSASYGSSSQESSNHTSYVIWTLSIIFLSYNTRGMRMWYWWWRQNWFRGYCAWHYGLTVNTVCIQGLLCLIHLLYCC